MKRKYYIYRHRTESDGRCFYIGCGSKKRAYDTRTGKWFGRSKEWYEIYENEGLIVEILLESEDKDLALELEALLIQEYGRICDGGSLVNKATYRSCGYNHTEEAKEKIRNTSIGRSVGKILPTRKPVLQYTKDGDFIKEWSCATIAAEKLNLHQQLICMCCNGKRKTTGGFIWKYKP